MFLLLTLTSCLSLINLTKKNNTLDENTLSLSPSTGDYMEPNDSFSNASWVLPSSYSGLTIEGSNEDWFSVYLNLGDTITVDINFSHNAGGLDLVLYDYNYTYKTGSTSTTDDESVSFTSTMPGGDWRIRVYNYDTNSSSTVPYDLDIMVFGGTTGDDGMEENDGFYEAAWINPNYYPDLQSVYGDEDWFQLYLNYGDRIEVDIFFNHGDGDLRIELYDPFYSYKNGSVFINSGEFVSFTADISGDWRIRVYQPFPDNLIYYGLETRLFGGVHVGDDPYEMNDFPNMAYWLGEDEQTWLSDLHGLAVQGVDDDWYAIEVTPGFLNLEVILFFNRSLGNITMTIYFLDVFLNHLGEPIWNGVFVNNSESESFNNSEYTNVDVDNYGIYLIRINRTIMTTDPDSEIEYNLWWDDNKTRFHDDSFEQNDNIGDAYDISAFELPIIDRQPREEEKTDVTGRNAVGEFFFIALELYKEEEFGLSRIDFGVQLDEDFYKLEIEEGFEHLIVFIRYDNAEGRMGLRLYDRHMNLLAENFTNSDNDFIDYVVPSNGTYYIKVFGDDTGNIYNLFWTALESEEIGEIPGYDLLIVLGAIIGISTIVIKKKRSKFKQN